MSDLPKWKISELITRYTLEPNLEDYYIEGNFDKDILEKFCNEQEIQNNSFYIINNVDIPIETLNKYSLTNGNKQRIIALAHELSILPNCSTKFIIDKDLDQWLGISFEVSNLYYTEFTCLEISLADKLFIKEILTDISKCNLKNWEAFLESFFYVLKSFFSIRLTAKKLNLSITWIDPHKNIQITQEKITFDHSEYINKLLINNSMHPIYDQFNQTFEESQKIYCLDYRYLTRAHDLTYLLALTIKRLKGIREFQNSEALQRLLLFNTKKIDRNKLPYVLLLSN